MHKYMRNLFFSFTITASLIGSVSAVETSLVINEFMASNNSCLQDPQGQFDDWIEIHNYGVDAIDLGGMYLTDNLSAPTKWQIPSNNPAATTIAAGGYHCLALATLENFTYPADVFPSERFYRPDLADPPIVLSGPSQVTAVDTPGCGAAPAPDRLESQTLNSASLRS